MKSNRELFLEQQEQENYSEEDFKKNNYEQHLSN